MVRELLGLVIKVLVSYAEAYRKRNRQRDRQTYGETDRQTDIVVWPNPGKVTCSKKFIATRV